MPGSRSSNNESEHKSPRESGDDSEDESEILEESPCGRWLKRKEEVSFVFKVLVDSGEFKLLLRHCSIDFFGSNFFHRPQKIIINFNFTQHVADI